MATPGEKAKGIAAAGEIPHAKNDPQIASRQKNGRLVRVVSIETAPRRDPLSIVPRTAEPSRQTGTMIASMSAAIARPGDDT
jgi:mRNA-degrading endonuclease toxin of MazEF toxin-antitoxin module